MTEDPASRAVDLVRRARNRAARHGVARALFRAVAVGALLAAAASVAALLLGGRPGPWLAAAGIPALLVAAAGLRHARPNLPASALLLDRAAGTKERFLSTLQSADPEVRELVARQALAHPSVASGGLPLTFPPSPEGLAAVLSVALLCGVLALGPQLAPPRPEGTRGELPGVSGAAGPAEEGDRAPDAEPGPPPGRAPSAIVTRIRDGEDLTEGDWEELSAAGLKEAETEALRAALAAGDREKAAKAARAALARAEPGRDEGAASSPWARFESALESPGWPPRYDRVIRAYFRGAGQRGLR